mgnify:CR=1 FL=1
MRSGWLLLVLVFWVAAVTAEPVERRFDGTTLKADYSAPTEPGHGVVLLYPDASRPEAAVWQPLQEALASAGYGVLVARPHGGDGSCNGPWNRLHRDGMAEVGGWFDWLLRRGIARVHFMGEGRGGNQVAWFLAHSRHPALGAALLVDPLVWRFEEAAADYRRQHGQPLAPLLERARELRAQGRADELLRGVGFLHCEAMDVSAAALLDYYAEEPSLDTSRLIGDLPGRAAILVGPEHPGGGRLERAADGAGAEFRVLTGGLTAEAPGAVVRFLRARGEDAAGQ